MVSHPPNSSTIASSNYHLLRFLKAFLSEKQLITVEDVEAALSEIFDFQSPLILE